MATYRREKFAPQTRIRARRRTLLKKSRNLQIRKKLCAKSRIFAHFEVYSAKPYKIRLYYTILPLGIFPKHSKRNQEAKKCDFSGFKKWLLTDAKNLPLRREYERVDALF